jgi:hypothetical protein
LLTALLLVSWAPGSWWCCCSAHAAEPAPDVVATAGADRDDPHIQSCCSGPAVTASPAIDAGNECCPLDSDEAPSCGCLHGATDAALPAVTTAPPTDKGGGADLDLLAAMSPAIVAATKPAATGSMCRGSPRAAPAQSLLSLRCLLTT